MKIEYEVRFLEINKDSLVKKLKSIGAIEVGDWFQIRKTFDLINPQQNSWLRLRTNGEITTLTVKEINSAKIDGTKEAEVVVNDFDEMDRILTKIGLKARNYQENRRHQFKYKNTEIDIDTWPLIPTYVEIEGKDEQTIKEVCADLGLNYEKATTMDVTDIYKNIYNIDILKIKKLKLK